ncbi:hypothetical protein [Kutzneria sp. 744]|uniref:hypothetical protein n=1 Tax=Kutzneria sp. (strain 744) TaxID=345341 RepID=UPI0003EEBE2C|nr:hypothetical protein [Kutzneria sp. 744]EWM15205.1 hypothetical protein KUTG_05509 [Kutzneria sp. 744]
MVDLLLVAHLVIAAIWLGSMSYSLTVVQPKVDRFFLDEEQREEFLVLLAHGNRWKVVGLVAALVVSGIALVFLVSPWYAVSVVLYAIAASIFWHVSWRHWPARIFAVVEELASYRRRLRILASCMVVLVGVAFVFALGVTVVRP